MSADAVSMIIRSTGLTRFSVRPYQGNTRRGFVKGGAISRTARQAPDESALAGKSDLRSKKLLPFFLVERSEIALSSNLSRKTGTRTEESSEGSNRHGGFDISNDPASFCRTIKMNKAS